MELRQLRYFAAVARRRHFTRAAADLHVAQSALSAQIRRLERELGFELLRRTSRRVELTEAGELVLQRAGRALAEADAISADLDRLTGLLRGAVALGAMPPIGPIDLADLLGGFHELHPGIDVRVREETAAGILQLLRSDRLDAGFASVHPHEIPDTLAALPVADEELVVVTAPGHPLARGRRRTVPLAALADHPFIAFRPDSNLRHDVDAALREGGVAPRVPFESHDLTTVRALAARGLGVTILPRSFVLSPGPDVAVLSLAPRPLTRPIVLLWRADRTRAPAAEAFLAYAQQAVERVRSAGTTGVARGE